MEGQEKGAERSKEHVQLVDLEHAAQMIIWGELAVVAMLSSYLLYTEQWLQVFGYFNVAFIMVLLTCICVAVLSAISWKLPVKGHNLAFSLCISVGITLVGYSLFNYQSGITVSNQILLPLTLGGLFVIMGIGLMMAHGDSHTRLVGSYTMWIFGIVLILFMPLHEVETSLGNGYSERDLIMAYIGIGVSLFGAITFLVADFDRKIAWKNLAIGDAKYISGKYEEAVEAYTKSLKVDSDNSYIWYSKGGALLRLGLYENALEDFNKALSIDDKIEGAWDEKGLALSYLGHFPEAIKSHEQSIELGGGSISWNNMGNTFSRACQYDQALISYETALKLDKNYEIARLNKAKTLLTMGRCEEAIRNYDTALHQRPVWAEGWFERGVALRSCKKYRDALHSLNMAIRVKPSYSMAWAEKENLLSEVKNLRRETDTLPVLKIPSTLPPEMPVIGVPKEGNIPMKILKKQDRLRKSATRLATEGDYIGAIALFDKALELNSENFSILGGKGMTYLHMGKLRKALDIFTILSQKNPSGGSPSFMRGLVLGQLGHYDEALEALDNVIFNHPHYLDAWNLKGILLVTRQKYLEALDCFDETLRIDPKDVEAWKARGKTLDLMGRFDEALQHHKKVTILENSIGVNHPVLQKRLFAVADHLFHEGIQHAKNGRYPEALEKLREALVIRPRSVGGWYISGAIYGRTKEYDKAIDSFERVLDIENDHGEALYDIGEAQLKLGRYKDALDTFDRLIKLEPENADAWCERGFALCHLNECTSFHESVAKALDIEQDHVRASQLKGKCSCEQGGDEPPN